jgi:hypothetical protein
MSQGKPQTNEVGSGRITACFSNSRLTNLFIRQFLALQSPSSRAGSAAMLKQSAEGDHCFSLGRSECSRAGGKPRFAFAASVSINAGLLSVRRKASLNNDQ